MAGGAVLLLAGCSGTADTGIAEPEPTPTTVTETVTETAVGSPTETAAGTSGQATVIQTVTETVTALPPSSAGDSRCTADDLEISLSDPEGAAGSSYYTLMFTNTGSAPCVMRGFPTVTYVHGDAHDEFGQQARPDGDAGTTVNLKAGAAATATLREVNVFNFDADVCKPTEASGINVYPPDADAPVFIAQDTHGCLGTDLPGGQVQMSVTAVQAK